VELDGKVLVLKRIHAHYRLRARQEQREVVERVHAAHVSHCPVARSLMPAISVSTSYELVT
jgi:uncharacterized OsmC-like protein